MIDQLVKDLELDEGMSKYKVKESDLDGVVAAGQLNDAQKGDMIEFLKAKM